MHLGERKRRQGEELRAPPSVKLERFVLISPDQGDAISAEVRSPNIVISPRLHAGTFVDTTWSASKSASSLYVTTKPPLVNERDRKSVV